MLYKDTVMYKDTVLYQVTVLYRDTMLYKDKVLYKDIKLYKDTLLYKYFQTIPSSLRVIACLFCKSATAFNPFIYFFMSKGFRRDTKVILYRWDPGLSAPQLTHFQDLFQTSLGGGINAREFCLQVKQG